MEVNLKLVCIESICPQVLIEQLWCPFLQNMPTHIETQRVFGGFSEVLTILKTILWAMCISHSVVNPTVIPRKLENTTELPEESLLCLCLEYGRKICIFRGINVRAAKSKDYEFLLCISIQMWSKLQLNLDSRPGMSILSFIFARSCREADPWDPLLWTISRKRMSTMRILKCEYVGNVSNFPECIWFLLIKMPRDFLLLWFLLGYKTGGIIIHVKKNYFHVLSYHLFQTLFILS